MQVHKVRVKAGLCGLVLPLFVLDCDPILLAAGAQQGLSAGQLMRGVGFVAAVAAFMILLAVEFLWRPRFQRSNYRWLLFAGLFILPIIVMLSVTTTLFEETKRVSSCASCHVMDPYISDMMNPESATLAGKHFKNKWISDHQCYACHTTYGIHGTMAAKRDGFRHWFLYVTGAWNEPIQYSGSYPNSNCLSCHEGTPKFGQVSSHQVLRSDLEMDRVACFGCHAPPHPSPASERDFYEKTDHSDNQFQTGLDST